MLRREELITCGTGARGAPWEPARAGKEEEVREAYQQQLKEGAPRRGCSRARWHHSWRGRTPTFSRKLLGSRTHAHYHQQQHYSQRCYRPTRPRVLLSLRPVNMMGKRAPGMRAPRNTNQFLMREKYQLMHLRSDSVGTESGGSDSEMDPQGLDSYLGVLENSRGALMDFAEDSRSSSWSPPASSAATDSSPSPQQQQLRFFGGGLADVHQEESLQYFPSEDDVIESETFMERDFHEFCSRIA